MTTTIIDHVARFLEINRSLGYRYAQPEQVLRSFARFAEARNETYVRSETALEWASASRTASSAFQVTKLRMVSDFAEWLHAEDDRHEIPPRDAFGPLNQRRPQPHLMSVADIRKLLTAALSMGPAATIAPLTWHYLFGLIAATGLRLGEALALTLDDITPDGLVIREAKFGKTRLVALHPTSWDALNIYLKARLKEATRDRHLFVIATGHPPALDTVNAVFRRLAVRTGLRSPGAGRGPTARSLRHSFAVRSLEALAPGASPDRHMLALATYLGHVDVRSSYWYLESTPVLLRGIAEAVERAHGSGGSHD
ncbi:MAG: tyrosine-type recombinase/integrase [Gammaproteobacteria bacterium]|nr:tyrosine-type recombinase/integrase [Gammaproteobacteria bacterium]